MSRYFASLLWRLKIRNPLQPLTIMQLQVLPAIIIACPVQVRVDSWAAFCLLGVIPALLVAHLIGLFTRKVNYWLRQFKKYSTDFQHLKYTKGSELGIYTYEGDEFVYIHTKRFFILNVVARISLKNARYFSEQVQVAADAVENDKVINP